MFFVRRVLDNDVCVIDTDDDVKECVSIAFVCKLKNVYGVTDGVRVFRDYECINADLVCMSLLGLSCKAKIEGTAYVDCGDLAADFVKVPYGIDIIATGAFKGHKNLKRVKIPSTVVRLAAESFDSCYSLESIEIPNSVKCVDVAAFANCINLSSVHLPNSLTNISVSLFSHCSSLKNIVIPDSVTAIGIEAFLDTGLERIIVPDSVGTIDGFAFKNSALVEVEIQGNIEELDLGTFAGCKQLSSVILPKSLLRVNASVFKGCVSLKRVVIPSTQSIIFGSDLFADCPNVVIECYKGSHVELCAKYNGIKVKYL